MSAAPTTILTAPSRRASVESAGARHPWFLPAAAAATGWLVLATGHAGVGRVPGHPGHALMAGAMVLAMMSPMAIGLCLASARASLWWQAASNSATALGSFLVLWWLTAVALHASADLLAAACGAGVLCAAASAWCVAGQIGHGRDRALARCDVGSPIRPEHRLGDAAAWGVVAARRCVRTCVAPMALTALHPSLPVISIVTLLLLGERLRQPRPRYLLGAAYAGLGAVLTIGSLIS
jgi:hypothetical protein